MRKIHLIILKVPLFTLLIIFLYSCGGKEAAPKADVLKREDMVELNRYMVQKDKEIIENYIKRKGLVMTESPTGMWYSVINEGILPKLTDGDRVLMEYECSLLDGTLCYTSANTGPKEFILGHSQMEAGLVQGLKLLGRGGEAMFILPPFLSYGLTGDGKKIPPRSIIMYKVEVLK